MASAGLLQLLAAGGSDQPSPLDRYNEGQQRGLKLADILGQQEARQFIEPALQGDKGALARLLYGNPELGLQINQRLEAEANRDEDRAWRKTTFDADQAYKKDYLGILQQKANQVGTGANQRGQVVDVGGKKVLINPVTGEPIRELGVSTSAQPKPLSASMLKLKRETENNLLDIGNTRENLKAAIGLLGDDKNPQVHSGLLPETRAFVGNTLPDWMVPDAVASPQSSKATRNYSNIMTLESIQRMANTLKGATTDFELNEFVKILADPSAPNSVKRQTMQRMMRLAESQEALERQRLNEFGGEMPKTDATPDGEQGSDDTYQNNLNDAIQQANDAIAAGADREAVMQRFREMFPDAEIE